MKTIKWNRIALGLGITAIIEIVTFGLLKNYQECRNLHEGSLDFLPFLYSLIFSTILIAFLTRHSKIKFIETKILVGIVLVSLFHTTYVLWNVECSCGNP
jgi:hypothetical protein